MVRIGSTSTVTAGACLLIIIFFGLGTPATLIPPLIWAVASLGFISPNAAVAAIGVAAANRLRPRT